ncbi:hypothetical protein ABZY36_36255 [Streptomyces sp. NPDC006627]|uniref:hypothetical protein n=1 Tax=Streptomyces sp. NPDC006627 TaxID=3154679 RepID=UPI0033B8D98D
MAEVLAIVNDDQMTILAVVAPAVVGFGGTGTVIGSNSGKQSSRSLPALVYPVKFRLSKEE